MEFSNKTKSLLVFICAFIVCVISTISYAYFTASVAGNNNASQTVVQTGNMALLLTDGADVSLENALPGASVAKTFKVKNTGTVATNYNVYLSEVVNDFADKNDLVYTLTSANGCPNVLESVVPSVAGDSSKIVSSCNINPNQEHEYVLTIIFKDDNTNQDNNKGKTFSAKLSVNEYQEKESNIKYVGFSSIDDLLYSGQPLGEGLVLFDTLDDALDYNVDNVFFVGNDECYDLDDSIITCKEYQKKYGSLGYAVEMKDGIVDKKYVVLKYNNKEYFLRTLDNGEYSGIASEGLEVYEMNTTILDNSDFVLVFENNERKSYELGDVYQSEIWNSGSSYFVSKYVNFYMNGTGWGEQS